MKLVTRSDDTALNLDAAIVCKPLRNDMIVEMANGEYYIIYKFGADQLYSDAHVKREWEGWPPGQ